MDLVMWLVLAILTAAVWQLVYLMMKETEKVKQFEYQKRLETEKAERYRLAFQKQREKRRRLDYPKE